MPTPKTLAGYPAKYFGYFERAAAGETVTLACTGKGGAVNERRKMYSWRKLLCEQGHPLGERSLGLTIRMFERDAGTGVLQWTLEISEGGGILPEFGLDAAESETDRALRLRLEEFRAAAGTPTQERRDDPAERLFEKMIAKQTAEQPPEAGNGAFVLCAHEWNEYDACIKCGTPRDAV